MSEPEFPSDGLCDDICREDPQGCGMCFLMGHDYCFSLYVQDIYQIPTWVYEGGAGDEAY